MTPPVVAGGMVVVALSNAHRVVALDAATGESRWSHTASGRIVAPPVLADGLCLFGTQAGWVECLRLADGELVWRFRAAPAEQRMVAFGQVESAWPVTGGVLVEEERAYFTAGRMSNLVGGLIGYAVNLRTGELLWRAKPPTGYEYTKENRVAPAYVNDLPVSGEGTVQLGHPQWIVDDASGAFEEKKVAVRHRLVKPLTVETLGGTRDGLLDFSRSRYQGPTDMGHGDVMQRFGDVWAQQLVVGAERIYGFQLPAVQTFYYPPEPVQLRNSLRLVAWDRGYAEVWSRPLDAGIEIHALIRAGDRLLATGTQPTALERQRQAVLWMLSTADGSESSQFALDALPASEGLAAAGGRVYMTTQDGRLVCLGE